MMAREGGLAVPSSLSFSVPFSPDSIASLSQRLPLFPCPNLWKMGFDSLHKLSLFKDCIPLGILVFGQVLGECFSVNEGMTSAFSW